MVRLRRPTTTVNEEDDNVLLYVVGPKSIILESVAVETKLSNTWLELLNDELKLGVEVDQGLYVCCSGYCPTAPKAGEGWRAELNEPIKDFIEKFERKRKQYRVRISFSYDVTDNQAQPRPTPTTPRRNRASNPANLRNSRRGRSATRSASPARRPNIVISTGRGNTTPVLPSTSNGVPTASTSSQNGYHLTRAQRNALKISKANGIGIAKVAKRPKVENYTEVHIQTNIPSVPGPHVFLNEDNLNSSQMLRIDNFRSVVKTECVSEYYDELEDEYDEEDGEEGERDEEQDERNEEEDNQDEREEEEENDEFGRMSDEEDNGNQLNSTEDNQVAEELRQLGIPFEEVKSTVERQFLGFSNAYMLRVQNEMKNLVKDKEWVDVFQRSPLAFYFIQDIFKDKE